MAIRSMELIDRDQELSALQTWWERVRLGGRSATVTVEGSAGIGKTTLVQAWLSRQREADRFVLTAQVDAYASGPFAPIRWALEVADRDIAPAERDRCLAALRSTTTGIPPEAPIGTLLADYLQAAGEGAVIVTIEDIHAADDDTLQLCTEVGRLVEVPVLLILTLRPNQGRASIGFESFLTRQADVGMAHRIQVRPLSDAGARQLFDDVSEHRATAAQLDNLTEITRGNPLFIRLSARLLRERPDTALPDRWPRSARDELLRRFVPVDSPEAMLGAQLAEFGRFIWAELPRLTSLAGVTEDRVREGITALLRSGVLRGTVAGVEFTHPLIREAFANLLSAQQRSELHMHLARLLFDSGDSESLFEAATHLSAAGLVQGDDHLLALFNAANSALWVSPSPAAAWFGQVRTAPATTAELRARATTGQITALTHAGRSIEAWELCQAAMAAIPADSRPRELIEASALLAFAAGHLDELIALLDEGRPESSTMLTRSFVAAGRILKGDVAAGRVNYEKCLQVLLDDPAAAATRSYLFLFGCAALLGDVDRVGMLRELTLHQAEESLPVEREVLLNGIDLQAHNLPGNLGRSLVDTSRHSNRISAAGGREITQSFQLFQTGEWDALLDYVPAQLELMRANGNPLAICGLTACATAALTEREQWTATEELLAPRDWLDDTAWGPLVQISVARLEVSRGQSATAIARLSKVEDSQRSRGVISMYSMVVDLLAQLLQDSGEVAAAERMLRGARGFVGGLDVPIQEAYTLLALARTTDDLTAARAAYESAHRMRMPLIQARCEVQLARLGDTPQERLRRAHDTFKKLGAVTERVRTEQVMRTLGINTPRGTGASDRLTAVESTIVRAVLQGRTNRQIAIDLHYSPKTIEMHLSRIYARTGRSGRVELVQAVVGGDIALADG